MQKAAESLEDLLPAMADDIDASFLRFATGGAGADLVFIFDTTGSMGGSIANAKAQATDLANLWLSTSTNGRIALVEFRDQDDAFVARIVSPLTSDAEDFQTAVNQLVAGGGGDTPEAQLSGVMTALDGLDWQPGATKVGIVITDALGKDPEPITGYTRAQAAQRALEIDPVAIYGVNVSTLQSVTDWMAPMAEATAGEVAVLGQGQTLSELLGDVINEIALSPVAVLGGPYFAASGNPVFFSADRSFDPDAELVSYKWDFDGDGTTNQTTTEPKVAHTYAGAYSGIAVVRVVSADGGEALASAVVTVDTAGLADDAAVAPTAASASVTGPGQVTVTWTPAPNDRADSYLVRLSDTALLRSSAVGAGNSVIFTGLDLSQPQTFTVQAANEYGPSAGTVTASVGGGSAWSPSVRVNDDSGSTNQSAPDVALAPDDTAHAVWRDARIDSTQDVFYARLAATSGTWSTNQRVNDVTTGVQGDARIAVDANGNAYAVWLDTRNGRNDIYSSKRPAATGVWSANMRVNTVTTFLEQSTPAVAVSSTGDALAVWYRKTGNNKYHIYSARLPAGASAWSPEIKVTSDQPAPKDSPDVAIGTNGTAYAVWMQSTDINADIWFATLTAGGSTWSANTRISDDTNTSLQLDPLVDVDGAGNVLAVWGDWGPNPDELRVRKRAANGTWSPSVLLANSGTNSPSLSVASDGSALAAWTDGVNSPTSVLWGSDRDPTTGTWSAPEVLNDTGSASASSPEVELGAARDVLVFGATGDIYARTR
jgi:Mg-chelatase subunit ChlD